MGPNGGSGGLSEGSGGPSEGSGSSKGGQRNTDSRMPCVVP